MTMVIFSNEVCSTFTVMSSRTLLSVHVLQSVCIIICSTEWCDLLTACLNEPRKEVLHGKLIVITLTGNGLHFFEQINRQYACN